MNRRTFIAISASTPFLFNHEASAKEMPPHVWNIIGKVQNILFPKTENMPSAKEFYALEYLMKNMNHESFDSDDYSFIEEGSSSFEHDFPEFLHASLESKESTIQKAVQDPYFERWFSRLIYYGFEAMLGDPLYGGNPKMIGWIALEHTFGEPQPSKTYGQHL